MPPAHIAHTCSTTQFGKTDQIKDLRVKTPDQACQDANPRLCFIANFQHAHIGNVQRNAHARGGQ